ncbi:hypothetical protein IGI86_002610 [Enterococcus sp. AZ188]|uniref:RNA polymerase sigma factor n=1 Tax=Enterococcus sp. AZ188 TaxID=2774678 RepID=UPI003D2FFB09
MNKDTNIPIERAYREDIGNLDFISDQFNFFFHKKIKEREVILVKIKEERYNAQLTRYFEKVIVNRSNNFYAKKFRQKCHEDFIENPSILLIDSEKSDENITVPNVIIFNVKLYIEDDELEKAIYDINEREKFYIVSKFIFGLTDKEIGQLLGISRQAVNNFKQRLFERIRIRQSMNKRY